MSIILYISIVLFAAAQSVSTKLYGKRGGDDALFNAVKATSALLLFLLFSLFGFRFHLPTLLFGVAYGVSLTASMTSGYKALTSGPMALTGMLVSFSVLIPMLYGIVFLHETPSHLNLVGFAALFAAILLIGFSKKDGEKKTTVRWFIYILITFLSNGICSVLQKEHQTEFPEQYLEEFMVFSMIVPAVLFTLQALLRLKQAKGSRGIHLGVISGAANGISNYATLALAGFENASALFPAISAGTVLMSLLCGFVLFKEKLRFAHIIALLFGIAAVVLLKL